MDYSEKDIKVSIIIPVYDVSSYIKACIESVLAQTYSNIECIIVDDATPDDSIEICERTFAKYCGPVSFRILHHERNRGLSAARNTGVAAASEEYVFFLDSDDEITPDCIEKLVKPVLKDETVEMVMGNFVCCYVNSRRFSRKIISKEQELTSSEAVRDYVFGRNGFYVYAWNKLIKRVFINQNKLFFKEGLLWEDLLWNFFILKHLSHLYLLTNITYLYFRRQDSITTGTSAKEQAHCYAKVYDEIANHFTVGEKGREAQYYMNGFCYMCLRDLESVEFRRIARKYIKALREDHYYKEMFMMTAVSFLSRFSLGREGVYKAANKYVATKRNRHKR